MGIGTLRSLQGASPTHAFPVLRWFALAWMIVWLPAYARVWGWSSFLHVCDVAVILTCAGLIFDSPLLLSSQAVSSLLGSVGWCGDGGSTVSALAPAACAGVSYAAAKYCVAPEPQYFTLIGR